MLIGLLSALVALAAGRDAGQTVVGYHIANWNIQITTDRLTGWRACRLARGGAIYGPDYVTFQFAKSIDTYAAVYKVDDGSPKVAIEPVEDVETLQMARLENPSMGRVRIPVAEVMGADRIAIRPNTRRQVAIFKLAGLEDAVAFAKNQGCTE